MQKYEGEVKMVKLGDICEIKTGTQINKDCLIKDKELTNIEIKYPYLNGGSSFSGYYNQYNTKQDTITISQGGESAGFVNFVKEKFFAGSHCYILTLNTNYDIDITYLYFVLKSKQEDIQNMKNGAGIPGLRKSDLITIEIPLPSLEEQKRIVEEYIETLDTNNKALIEQLKNENTMLKEQVNDYHNSLLDISKNKNYGLKYALKSLKIIGNTIKFIGGGVENEQHLSVYDKYKSDIEKKIDLREICEIKTGQTISKQNISNNPGEYPVINSGIEPLGWYNKYNVENNPLGITSRGANVGYITWQEGKYWHGGLNYLIIPKDGIDINLRYLYYNFKANQNKIYKLCEFNGIPALNASNLKKLEITLPPLSIQTNIVELLDKFIPLYKELGALIDKEIELKQKQYEYYRNQLLTYSLLGTIGRDLDITEVLINIYNQQLAQKLKDLGVQKIRLGDLVKFYKGEEWISENIINGKSNIKNNVYFLNQNSEIKILNKSKILFKIKDFQDKINQLFLKQKSKSSYILELGFISIKDILILSPNENIIYGPYLNYCIYNFRNLLQIKSIGSSIFYLEQDMLENYKLFIPSLEIQKIIVQILDDLHNHFEKIKHNNWKLKNKQYELFQSFLLKYKYSLNNEVINKLLEYFGFFLIDLDKYDKTVKIKIKKYSLGEICEIKSGGTPNRDKSEYWEGGSIAWFKSGDINNNSNLISCDECITQEGVDNSSAKLFPKGTLLMTMYRATAGRVAITGIDGTFNQAISAIIPKDNTIISNKYLFYYLINIRDKLLYDLGDKYGIGNEYIKNITISLPPIEVQKAIAQILDTYTEHHNNLIKELKKYKLLLNKQEKEYIKAMLNIDS